MISKRALVVDDEDFLASDGGPTKLALERLGIPAEVVGSVDEALKIARGFDLFIIDYVLNGPRTGMAAIEPIRRLVPDAFIIIYSQWANGDEQRARAEDKKPDMILLKVDPEPDVAAMAAAYAHWRLNCLEVEQSALTFLAPRLVVMGLAWILGMLASSWISFPWLSVFRWNVAWTLLTVVPFLVWTAHGGEALEKVRGADLFREFLVVKNAVLGIVGAVLLKVVVDIAMKQ